MSDPASVEETAAWQKRLASQANNRAWDLAESTSRSPEEDEEMLQAAHAAMYFWKIVGNPSNRAHAAQLLAHVYALLKLPNPAKHYLKQSQPFFLEQESAPWERAFAHAIAANVAAAAGEREPHSRHYEEAKRLVAALADPEDRAILDATMRVIPRPVAA
jgi:predicted metal-dependent phosphoesterase TrpH